MSRLSACILVCLMVFAAVVAGGCGKAKEAVQTAKGVGQAAKLAADLQDGEATIKTPDGDAKIEFDEDSETMTMKTTDKDGQVIQWSSGSADFDAGDLGADIYPGAKQEGGGTVKGPEGEITTVNFTSTDDFEKVAKFYTGKYPEAEKTEMSHGDVSMLLLHIGEEPDTTMVTVQQEEGAGEVSIVLMRQQEHEDE